MSETSDEQTLAQFAATLASLRGEESLAARLCEASRRMLNADGSERRWAMLQERLAMIDFVGHVTAIPLHAEVTVIGVLTVHSHNLEQPNELQIARFLGAAVGTALLQHPQIDSLDVLGEAWNTRSEVHQATGMIVAQIGVAPEDALALLRGQAFARNLSLNDVAREIVSRRINFRNFTIKGD